MYLRSHSLRLGIVALAGLLLAACQYSAPKLSAHTLPAPQSTQGLSLYSAQPAPNIRIVIESPAAQQLLSGPQAAVPRVADSSAPNADVVVIKSDKNAAGDALTFSWKDTWRAALNFETSTPLDLTGYMAQGVVELDLNVLALAKGGLAFKSSCGKGCERQIPYLLPARELIGKGWQHLVVPLQCFVHQGDNFSAVSLPFALETGGEGTLAVANVRLQQTGQANVSCPDYQTLAVTPSMLNEWWSLDWWLPRHLQKLEQTKAHPDAQLIFIGDSITQGWERDGFNVWNHNYAQYHALAFGFGGDRTENILWRLQQGEVDGLHPKVAVLMFGTNNTGARHEDPQLTAKGIARDIAELQQRLPNTKILLLAIFPRDEKPDSELRQINNRVNAIIAGFADNKKVFFLDIGPAFLDANGVLSKSVMPDLLHPNERGYEIWAKAMAPKLQALLQAK